MLTNSSRRKIRYRGGTTVITLPPNIVKFLNFSIKEFERTYKRRKVVNLKGDYAFIIIWLNRDWNIEFGHNSFQTEDVNGVLLDQYLHPHGGSVELTIPSEIVKTLDAVKSGRGDLVEVFINKRNNVELKIT